MTPPSYRVTRILEDAGRRCPGATTGLESAVESGDLLELTWSASPARRAREAIEDAAQAEGLTAAHEFRRPRPARHRRASTDPR